MESKYFREFKFTQPKYKVGRGYFVYNISERQVDIDLVQALKVELPPFPALPESNVVSVDEILPDIKEIIHEINSDLGSSLTMKKRKLQLVDIKELKPKSPRQIKRLVERYGEYILNEMAGDCTLLKDGNYRLRVGIEEGNSPKDIVLEIAAHEYGHTLGNFLESAVDEELKAYTFASLFESYYFGGADYEEERDDLRPGIVHDIALHKLGELLRAGVPEGAIISHLIGRRFGRFAQNDYLKFIK